MSAGKAIPHADALAAAVSLRMSLEDVCERIEVAGSLRRRKPEVHDLELVAIPRVEDEVVAGLWGDTAPVDRLGERIADLISDGIIRPRDVEIHRRDGSVEIGQRMGSAYRALEYDGMPVDLFTTDAERWGCIYALRTGPGDWNTRLVTDCKRWFRSVSDGRVLHLGRPVPTPEESDFFRALGVPWLDPWDRTVDRLTFDPSLFREAAS